MLRRNELVNTVVQILMDYYPDDPNPVYTDAAVDIVEKILSMIQK